MQQAAQLLRPTKENPSFSRGMDLAYRFEYSIPIRSAKIRRRAEACDCVAFGVGVVNHYFCCVVVFDVCLLGEGRTAWWGKIYGVDFNMAVHILGFNSHE